MPLTIEKLSLPTAGGKTISVLIAGDGPDVTGNVAYIVGPGSFYLKGLSQIGEKCTLVTRDDRWAHYEKDKVDESAAKSATLETELEHELEAIKAIKAHFGCSKIGLIGFSAPGAIALRLALDYPEHVAWVNATGIALGPLDPSFSLTDKVFREKADPKRVKQFDEGFENYQKLLRGDPDGVPSGRSSFVMDEKTGKPKLSVNSEYLEQVRFLAPKLMYDQRYKSFAYQHWENNPLGKIVNQPLRGHFFGTIQSKLDAPALLKQLEEQGKVPIFLANGKDDFITPMDDKIAAEVGTYKNVTLKSYDKCAHLVYVEKGKQYAQDFGDFLASVPKPSQAQTKHGSFWKAKSETVDPSKVPQTKSGSPRARL